MFHVLLHCQTTDTNLYHIEDPVFKSYVSPPVKFIHWIELCGHVLLSWLYEISPLDCRLTWHLHSAEDAFVFSVWVMNCWNLSPRSSPSGHSFALSTPTMDSQINWDSVLLHGNQFPVYGPTCVLSHATGSNIPPRHTEGLLSSNLVFWSAPNMIS